jgi:IS5 family transposase
MYKKSAESAKMDNLPLFLNGTLQNSNRWVKLATMIPWEVVEEIYAQNFKSHTGPKALSSRVALGALIIQIKLSLTDEETVNQIIENPYLQHFIGLEAFQDHSPFDASMMTHFRKRFNMQDIQNIDEFLHQLHKSPAPSTAVEKDDDSDLPPDAGNPTSTNKGKLIVDASCAPADIHFPTDLALLDKAREKSELIIDILWKTRSNIDQKIKPRTYRTKGRKAFIAILKQKRPGKKKIRAAINTQLCCLRRNFETIKSLKLYSDLNNLGKSLYKDLLVIHTLYDQQLEMYNQKKHSVADRIVSIRQPHVRPIVRGKAGARTEFGAKISISVINGWNFVDTISFDSYNEGKELQEQIRKYRERMGFYPQSVHADKIYRNKENRQFCQKFGIRLSGPKLGRPSKDEEKIMKQKAQEYADEGARNIVEGRFGIGKRRYGLDKIMAKLKGTSETVIALIFMVMNLDAVVHFLVSFFWSLELSCRTTKYSTL